MDRLAICTASVHLAALGIMTVICMRQRRELHRVERRVDELVDVLQTLEDRVERRVDQLGGYDLFMRELWNSRRLLRQLLHPDNRHTPLHVPPDQHQGFVNLFFIAWAPEEAAVAAHGQEAVAADRPRLAGSYRRVQQTQLYRGALGTN